MINKSVHFVYQMEETKKGNPGPHSAFMLVEDWPLWRLVAYRVYHFYDMRIPCRVPGWKWFKGLLRKHGAEVRVDALSPRERWRDRLYAWPIRQDLRCYEFSTKYFTAERVDISVGEAKKLSGRWSDDPIEEPVNIGSDETRMFKEAIRSIWSR